MPTVAVQCERPASCKLLTHDQSTRDGLMNKDYQGADWHCLAAGGEQFETHVIADKYGHLLDYGPDSGVVDAFDNTNGTIKRFACWPVRLTNTILQQLTQ